MEDFIQMLIKEIELQLNAISNDFCVEHHSVLKSNDEKYQSIIIRKVGDRVSKNIYVESFYDMYKNGKPLSEIAAKIIEINNNKADQKEMDNTLINISNYEEVEERIIINLLSMELNEDYLEDKAYEQVEGTDLAKVLYILFNKEGESIATAVVQDRFVELWNVDRRNLFSKALENTMRLFPAHVQSMDSIIDKMLLSELDIDPSDMSRPCCDLYVMTNDKTCNGAICALYDNALSSLCEEWDTKEIVVLPSSRHEVLLMKQDGSLDYEYCESLVKEINSTEVDHSDILSNHVYMFRKEEQKLIQWNRKERFA